MRNRGGIQGVASSPVIVGAVTVLVVIGLREAIMNAVPISLKRSIGVGIGLFILFIGFANGRYIFSSTDGFLNYARNRNYVECSNGSTSQDGTCPAGTDVTPAIWLTHTRPEAYPEPYAFRPERFAPGHRERIAKGAYVPFGGGSRMCIGMRFGLAEVGVIAAAIAGWRSSEAVGSPARRF